MNKICRKCGEEKPLSEYHKHKGGKLGLNPRCKACRKEFARTERGKLLQKVRGQRYKATERGRLLAKANAKKSRSAWPTKHQARDAVNHAVTAGKIVKPDNCSLCGSGGIIHGHHDSYEIEHWLDVQWLCVKCHVSVHESVKNGEYA